MEKIIEFIQNIEIFSLLTLDEIKSIIKYVKINNYKKDDVIFREGDEGNELYIIMSGNVSSTVLRSDGKEHQIVAFKSGDFFGEMSIFENAPRSASCYAIVDSSLLRLHENDFNSIMNSYPEIAIKIMHRMLNIITMRLNNTSNFLSDIVMWGEDARKRTITDKFTGIYNRRFLDTALEENFNSAKREKQNLCLVMVDLDHFRDINEQYSQKVGDNAILDMVTVFKKNLRDKDILARYGGDEFTIIMPDTAIDDAFDICSKICADARLLDTLSKLKGSMTRITTSQGIACYPLHADNLKVLKEKADQGLYKAKTEGRDRAAYLDY